MKKGLDGAVEAAINSIGTGYDLCHDLSLKHCKASSRLIVIDGEDQVQNVKLPGGIFIPNVPISIRCYDYKESRHRLCSDVLSFDQMSEKFNQELSLSGNIPTGHFNAAFDFSGIPQIDAAAEKTLAFDGYSITLCKIAYEKNQLVLCDHVKHAVPSSWDPAALTRFIKKYGTHVVVGLKIGGTDIIYAKQPIWSPLQAADVQKQLMEKADKFFIDSAERYNDDGGFIRKEKVQSIKFIRKKKGGIGKILSHKEWCQSVRSKPDVISMSFIPITSLLGGINGSGYLSYATDLYLRYKPTIFELHQFLEFQLPRQWAPVFGELAFGPGRRPKNTAPSKLSFIGPNLYVNTTPVDVGKKPVTGLRLYLEGKKSNSLAIHLQHLSSLPKTLQLEDDPNANKSFPDVYCRRYYKKVQLKSFSHVCTIPVESDNDSSVVTGARFEIKDDNQKKVLFLKLHFFSIVVGATIVKTGAVAWDGSPFLTQKSGIISTLVSTSFSALQNPLSDNTRTPKLMRVVDTTEITRGPQDSPGYWIVSGARLVVENGKISLRVKYSLFHYGLPMIKTPNEAAEEDVYTVFDVSDTAHI